MTIKTLKKKMIHPIPASEETKEIYPIPGSEGFRWMRFREIPETIEDYKKKRKTWPGFNYAMKKIGLEPKDVENRALKKKPPWKDYEEQREKCARAREVSESTKGSYEADSK